MSEAWEAHWLDLWEARRLVVMLLHRELQEVARGINDRYDLQALKYTPENAPIADAFAECGRLLKVWLAAASIAGTGSRIAGSREALSDEDWATRYINIDKSILEAPPGGDPSSFPAIRDVRVKAADIRRLAEESAGADSVLRETYPKADPKSRGRHSAAEVERFYQERVRLWSDEKTPSEVEDWEALKTRFPGLARERARELRRANAPDTWKSQGRRPHK